MSINFPKNIFLLAIIFFFYNNNCFAWTGYDLNNNAEIEISSGNLVREGETIRFYDWGEDEDKSGEVKSVDYLFNRTRLEIYESISNEVRIFDMEN